MRAFITDPAATGGVALREFPTPEPLPHEALVKVETYSISTGELTLLRMRPDGFRPGQEVAGIVVQAAIDGSGPPVGSRVTGLCHGGGWAEYVAVPGDTLGIVPDAVGMDIAIALGGSGLMAHRALDALGPLEGRRILITGAAGAVGNVAVQLALRAGAHVTALVSALDRIGNLTAAPGLTIVTSLDEGDGPYDGALDGVGGDVLPAAIRRLAPGATILIYGGVGGPYSPITPGDFRGAPGAKLMGFFLWLTDNATFGRDISLMCDFAAQGVLSPRIGLNLPWTQTAEMVRAMRAREVIGKAVLTVGAP
jgi:NADPH:quinone reductase